MTAEPLLPVVSDRTTRQTSTVEGEAMDLPDGMVEAAARALWMVDRAIGDTFEDRARHWRQAATHALSAALAGCEVEVQRSFRGEDDGGPWITYIHSAEGEAATRARHPELKAFVRLEITTPWTPNAEESR
jgi:hypothetical protein